MRYNWFTFKIERLTLSISTDTETDVRNCVNVNEKCITDALTQRALMPFRHRYV